MRLQIDITALNGTYQCYSTRHVTKRIEIDLPDGMTEIPDLSSVIQATTKAVNDEYNDPERPIQKPD